jgi:hypothetical protein
MTYNLKTVIGMDGDDDDDDSLAAVGGLPANPCQRFAAFDCHKLAMSSPGSKSPTERLCRPDTHSNVQPYTQCIWKNIRKRLHIGPYHPRVPK